MEVACNNFCWVVWHGFLNALRPEQASFFLNRDLPRLPIQRRHQVRLSFKMFLWFADGLPIMLGKLLWLILEHVGYFLEPACFQILETNQVENRSNTKKKQNGESSNFLDLACSRGGCTNKFLTFLNILSHPGNRRIPGNPARGVGVGVGTHGHQRAVLVDVMGSESSDDVPLGVSLFEDSVVRLKAAPKTLANAYGWKVGAGGFWTEEF